MKKIVSLDGREIHAEKMDDPNDVVIKDIAMKLATYVNGQDFNIVLNSVVLFLSAILEMSQTNEEEARDVMDNMKIAVLCRTYDIGEENIIQ